MSSTYLTHEDQRATTADEPIGVLAPDGALRSGARVDEPPALLLEMYRWLVFGRAFRHAPAQPAAAGTHHDLRSRGRPGGHPGRLRAGPAAGRLAGIHVPRRDCRDGPRPAARARGPVLPRPSTGGHGPAGRQRAPAAGWFGAAGLHGLPDALSRLQARLALEFHREVTLHEFLETNPTLPDYGHVLVGYVRAGRRPDAAPVDASCWCVCNCHTAPAYRFNRRTHWHPRRNQDASMLRREEHVRWNIVA